MKQPEHLAGPAFKKAADKIAFLETQLSEAQKAQYAEFVRTQEKAKEEQKRKAGEKRAEYDEANQRHPQPARNYDPPFRIRNPYLRQLAQNAVDQQHKVTALALTQLEDRLRFLEKLEQQRAEQQQEKLAQFRDNTRRMTRSQASPEFGRAATPEQEPKARQDFGRSAIAGKAKTDFRNTANLDPAKAEAIVRTVTKIKKKEKQEEKERERGDRDQGRGRSLSDTFNKVR